MRKVFIVLLVVFIACVHSSINETVVIKYKKSIKDIETTKESTESEVVLKGVRGFAPIETGPNADLSYLSPTILELDIESRLKAGERSGYESGIKYDINEPLIVRVMNAGQVGGYSVGVIKDNYRLTDIETTHGEIYYSDKEELNIRIYIIPTSTRQDLRGKNFGLIISFDDINNSEKTIYTYTIKGSFYYKYPYISTPETIEFFEKVNKTSLKQITLCNLSEKFGTNVSINLLKSDTDVFKLNPANPVGQLAPLGCISFEASFSSSRAGKFSQNIEVKWDNTCENCTSSSTITLKGTASKSIIWNKTGN